jgi:RNA polymerase sigma-70 factor (ECF subfamily)
MQGRDAGLMAKPVDLVSLLASAAQGDDAAFERLYAATRAKLYGIIIRILRRADLADEVMQEAYLQIWRSARDFDSQRASPMTWMIAIARNRAIDLVRRKSEISIEEETAAMEVAAETIDPLGGLAMTEDLRRLLGCLGGLDDERRQMVLLAYYDGASREELATKFDKPVNTIKTWLRRSLIELRECLGP